MEWNLLELTIMMLFLNQFIALSVPPSKFEFKFFNLSEIEGMVLSPLKIMNTSIAYP